MNPAGVGGEREEGLHPGAGARTVDVDATDADGAEVARPGEPVEQPCIDEGRVQTVEHLDEAVDHLPKRLNGLGEVRHPSRQPRSWALCALASMRSTRSPLV